MRTKVRKIPPKLGVKYSAACLQGAASVLCSSGVSGTLSHLLSSWLHVLGGTERAVLTSVKAPHQDEEKAARGVRGEASSRLLVVIRSLYDANHM